MEKVMEETNMVTSVVRTMNLLETLSTNDEMSLTEISKSSNLHKSTLLRFLNTLVSLGYLYRNHENDKFGLTLKLYGMTVHQSMQIDLKKFSIPVMERIAGFIDETIHLASIEDDQLIYLHKIESQKTLRVVTMQSGIGKSAPLYSTALGKVLLAWQNAEFLKNYIKQKQFNKLTMNTITDRVKLTNELSKIRSQGFSVDNEENEVGVRCVAAPIYDAKQFVVGAISISGPTIRMSDEKVKEYSETIINGAYEISQKLGGKI